MKVKRIAKSLDEYLRDADTELPEQAKPEQLAFQIVSWHKQHGGSTYNLYFGNQVGTKTYAASLYPECSLQVQGKDVPFEIIRKFIQLYEDLLSDPRLCVETWFNKDEEITYIDVIAILTNRKLAKSLGKEYNQIAIFDLFNEKEIYIGGDGTALGFSIPVDDRLPPLKRTRRRKKK